jgi:phosphoglycerate dehydrogenase-like enzyme
VSSPEPRVAIVPEWPLAAEAVARAGGRVVGVEDAEALVWVDWSGPGRLASVLEEFPAIGWVHLPGAGIESFLDSGVMAGGRLFTCSKGAHSSLIAEHALALALAGLHSVASSARASTWVGTRVTALAGAPVTIVGGGGIASSLITMLAPFEAPVTVVRRHPDPVPGAVRTLTTDALHEALPDARVVVLALALTPETRHIIAAPELAAMHDRAWLVNVSRGGHVDTAALVEALEAHAIAGAALDVTEPEPLPDGHPLWSLPNCIVTPHHAGSSNAVMALLANRIYDNVVRLGAGEPLLGVVDPEAGY